VRELRTGLLCAVRLHVMFRGFLSVMRRIHVMALGQVGMVRRRLVIAFLVMLRGFPVVVGRVVVMLGGLGVVMRSFLRHCDFLSTKRFRMASWNLRALSKLQVAGELRTGEFMVKRPAETG